MAQDDQRNRTKAPIVEALHAYAERKPTSFHVPGHKRGSAYVGTKVASWLGAVGLYDATELPGLDDLHAPSGPIREAQELAARCFGAERTFFLVGGSTVGNLAMISAVCKPGEIVLMQRNAHKSAIHALMLAQAGAVFLGPEEDKPTGLYTAPTAEQIDEQLRRFPDAKAIFITNPNYFGMSVDIEPLAEAAHRHGKPLLVDEAHGAHFGLHPGVPKSALQCGADAVVQSTHKMLPAMTLGSMLHLQGGRIDYGAVEKRLRMLQSSSPSYPILASLDWARSVVEGEGADGLYRGSIEAVEAVRTALGRKNLGKRFGTIGNMEASAYLQLDPFKFTLYDMECRLSGYELQSLLAEYGCDAEMADERYVLLVFGLTSDIQDARRLIHALEQIARRFSVQKQENCTKTANNKVIWPKASEQPVYFTMDGAIPPFQAKGEPTEVRIEDAAGEWSAEMVVPYPPGIPVVYPGELITSQAVQALLAFRSGGASVQGVRDPLLERILVWRGKDI
ncbi:aminotransferase class I/II-fold pyridoxal phosphate-dependent enzyme [Paenibacillus thermotolerans]|uniref:aminotransferase class I/II-fold pyridoxal phosphate-dependent enzyme n=1 Tax=Paenibacillus thermotolerans TaxID=3027807 RepID=UPI00236799DC|nr:MULTISPECIES: aminotransferase class V-fold PLP-dependent enzyme [unclassified Paenibacillus]